jgi:hypothetical protein
MDLMNPKKIILPPQFHHFPHGPASFLNEIRNIETMAINENLPT